MPLSQEITTCETAEAWTMLAVLQTGGAHTLYAPILSLPVYQSNQCLQRLKPILLYLM